MRKRYSCPKCGSIIPEGIDVCPDCGFDIKYLRESNNVRNSLPGIVIVPIILTVLLIIVLTLAGIRGLAPTAVLRLHYWETGVLRQLSSTFSIQHTQQTQGSSNDGSSETKSMDSIGNKKHKEKAEVRNATPYAETLISQSSDELTITETGWVRNGTLILVYAKVRNDTESETAILPQIEVTAESGDKILGSCTLNGWTIPCKEERILTGNLYSDYAAPDKVTFTVLEDCEFSRTDPSWNPLVVESVTIEENGYITVTVRNDNDGVVKYASMDLIVTDTDGYPVWLNAHPLYEDVPAFGKSSWTFHPPHNLDLSGCFVEVSADGYFPENE